MRFWLTSLFLLLFTVQAVALAVELEVVNSHDQMHHELGSGHANSESQAQEQDNSHMHLCHHHHGEHTAKVLIHEPDLNLAIISQTPVISFSFNYENIASLSLFRPPIA